MKSLFEFTIADNKRYVNNNLRTMGSSSITSTDRQNEDYYATDPIAIDTLLNDGNVVFDKVWEPCCGEGHLAKRLKDYGVDVIASDIIDRGYGEVKDFLKCTSNDRDIVTNPPYRFAEDFILHALNISKPDVRIFMLLKLTFLEGKSRRKTLFNNKYLRHIYVYSSRVNCARDGRFDLYSSSAVAYAWFEFCKNNQEETTVSWIN